MTRPAEIRSALTVMFLAFYGEGERVISAERLAATLGIARSSAYSHLHAAARAAGVRLWRSAWGLVVEMRKGE